jgi:hypothetical protein
VINNEKAAQANLFLYCRDPDYDGAIPGAALRPLPKLSRERMIQTGHINWSDIHSRFEKH